MQVIPVHNLSYSGLLEFQACPRKFYLNKCTEQTKLEDFDASVTFAFGTVVGIGIQEYMRAESINHAIWEMFLAWEPDLLADDPKRKKSFWEAVFAVQKFAYLREHLFGDYDLATFQGKPAIELSFRIKVEGSDPDKPFYYRGFVDLVLRHRSTGKLLVLENKTTAAKNTDPAMYKNSFQGIGYSVVLDHIDAEMSSYMVNYLVYNTNDQTYLELPFPKSMTERAEWLTDLWMQTRQIEMYEMHRVFPKRGQSCFNYFKPCWYYSSCNLRVLAPIEYLTDDTVYDVEVSFEDLIQAQITKERLK